MNRFLWLATLALLATSPSAQTPAPPRAKQIPQILSEHGHARVDPYYWLKERENPEVLNYLSQENEYLKRVMAHTQALQEKLFKEIVGRIKQDDDTVPVRQRDFYYYKRFREGGEYAIHCRKKGSLDAAEEVMLDENELAKGHEFFALRADAVSSSQDILAFAVDTVGRLFHTIRFKNLRTGEFLPDTITNVTANIEWAEDNRTLFYARQDPDTLRSFQIYRHALGTDRSEDVLVYEEKDERFSCFVSKTKSRRYLFIVSSHLQSTEYRFLDAGKPDAELRLLQRREPDHIYSADHLGEDFYIQTNFEAKNHRLVKTPVSAPGKANWREVIPHREEVLLEGFELFQEHLVIEERKDGLNQMRIRPWSGKGEHYVEFGEPAYLARTVANPEMDTASLRFIYTSLATPWSTYDYDMAARTKTLRKQEEVLGGFDPGHYRTERRFARARDGERIPISIVYRTENRLRGRSPLLLYGYGSYGASRDAQFRSELLSLLDRGFVYAIAHIRGGQELGRRWYEAGRLFNKMNTFTDFIDCGEFLIREGYADRDRLFAKGGSAGGLLMGAVVNLRPDLFKGVVADVPFVDVVTTMLDDSIPLTTFEYEEWGNPHVKKDYDYMLSYSPYDNVAPKSYPHLLVLTGLHDSQVQYWEPAKWVAKLRATKSDSNRLLLHTNMDAGHGGATGRFKAHRETALVFAFLLDLAMAGEN